MLKQERAFPKLLPHIYTVLLLALKLHQSILLHNNQMTACNVKGVTQNVKTTVLTDALSCSKLFSHFQLIVSVYKPLTLLFWFWSTPTGLQINHQNTQYLQDVYIWVTFAITT